MFLRSADLPHRWVAEAEPGLVPVWRRLASLANTRVVVSAEELAAIEDAIESVLAPYVTRDPSGRGTRRAALAEPGECRTGGAGAPARRRPRAVVLSGRSS
jgi:hypothetical protein